MKSSNMFFRSFMPLPSSGAAINIDLLLPHSRGISVSRKLLEVFLAPPQPILPLVVWRFHRTVSCLLICDRNLASSIKQHRKHWLMLRVSVVHPKDQLRMAQSFCLSAQLCTCLPTPSAHTEIIYAIRRSPRGRQSKVFRLWLLQLKVSHNLPKSLFFDLLLFLEVSYHFVQLVQSPS